MIKLAFLFWSFKHVSSAAAPYTDEFGIDTSRGMWRGIGAAAGHMYDTQLQTALNVYLANKGARTVFDFGAGMGNYTKGLRQWGIGAACYDGNPDTQKLSDGRCAVIDLSRPIDLGQADWVMSLEVGEHIPKEFEATFIDNLARSAAKGVILSWAVLGQGGDGHFNCQTNEYVKTKMQEAGFMNDEAGEYFLRQMVEFPWFKNSLMVFVR